VIIDAHQHIWTRTVADYDWLTPAAGVLYRDFTMADVAADRRAAGVAGVVLVQAADDARDTAHMQRAADADPAVVAIVAWVPLDAPAATARALERLREDDRIVGVRALIHERDDPDWILRDDVAAGLAQVAAAGLAFDYVTASPAALAHLPRLGERHPDLRLIIDHLGKPPVGGGGDTALWRRLLAAAAENPRVHAKVSGLYPAVTPADWAAGDIRPLLDAARELFGADRLLAGSDWPISLIAGGYARTWEGIQRASDTWSADERSRLLGGTAAECYRIDPGRLARAKEDL